MAKRINYQQDTRNIWFPDQREPDNDDPDFMDYWNKELDRIENGFYIADNQVYISGALYWHTVYWVIELDTLLPNGKSFKTPGTPLFRDIEWEFFEDIERAELEQKVFIFVGSRGFGKSNLCASIVGRMYNFFKNSESVTSAGFENDYLLLNNKIELGLSNCHPIFWKQRLLGNWKKEVRAGWIDKSDNKRKGSNSRIIVRNYEGGVNTMAANGTRPKIHIMDEIGKIPNLENCFWDTMPCWNNDHGMFTLPILTGTGGDMEVGEDAGKMFNSPEVFNALEFDDIWEDTGKIGKFVPVTKARNEYKEKKTLYEYLTKTLQRTVTYHPDLDVEILVSNEQLCMEKYVNPRRERALKSSTTNAIIKEKAYYPITPSESFLVVSANDFPVEMIKEHKSNLEKEFIKTAKVELYTDVQNVITHKFTEKSPVTEFPVQANSNKEGVIEVVEFPIMNPPFGLYVAGIDPYKTSESDYSDSLGSIYIFKRMTSNMSEPYQNMPVAWYTGRPKNIMDWHENVRMLIKWYGASAMCENIDGGFIQYMISKNEEHYLAQGQSYLRKISPGSKHRGQHGLPPTPAMINHWNNAAINYMKEVIDHDKEKPTTGTVRILDLMLLQEMIKYNKNKGNFDRVRSFSIAVAYARQLDGIIDKVNLDEETTKPKRSPKSPFSMNRGKFSGGKSPFNLK